MPCFLFLYGKKGKKNIKEINGNSSIFTPCNAP
jgi:hypothetical protein